MMIIYFVRIHGSTGFLIFTCLSTPWATATPITHPRTGCQASLVVSVCFWVILIRLNCTITRYTFTKEVNFGHMITFLGSSDGNKNLVLKLSFFFKVSNMFREALLVGISLHVKCIFCADATQQLHLQ